MPAWGELWTAAFGSDSRPKVVAGLILGGLRLSSRELRTDMEELIPVMINLNKENANSKFSLGKQWLCK